jgi:MFS superfamily sulfate permease-like transporter
VKRHYQPRDRVLSWTPAGVVETSLPTPGTVSEPGLVIYRFGVGVFYANAGRLADEALGLVGGPDPPRWFVLDAGAIDDVDYTGGKTLAKLADQLRDRHVVFAIAGANHRVRRELDRFGVTAKIGEAHYYPTADAARRAFHAS